MLVEEEAAGRQLIHKEAGSTWQHPSPSHREVAAGAVGQGKEENQLMAMLYGVMVRVMVLATIAKLYRAAMILVIPRNAFSGRSQQAL